MSHAQRAQQKFADLFAPENGWRALSILISFSLIYNGLMVGVEYQGRSLAQFLSSSLTLLVWPDIAWAATFIAIGAVTLCAELFRADASWRCVLMALVLACYVIAAFAIVFSDNPLPASGRYWLGAGGALAAFLADVHEEKEQRAEQRNRERQQRGGDDA